MLDTHELNTVSRDLCSYEAYILAGETKTIDLLSKLFIMLEYGMSKAYATRILAIDVNLKIDDMLDTAWELFGTYFTKAETGIKQEFIDQYWKGN